jgi:hypothetical protein
MRGQSVRFGSSPRRSGRSARPDMPSACRSASSVARPGSCRQRPPAPIFSCPSNPHHGLKFPEFRVSCGSTPIRMAATSAHRIVSSTRSCSAIWPALVGSRSSRLEHAVGIGRDASSGPRTSPGGGACPSVVLYDEEQLFAPSGPLRPDRRLQVGRKCRGEETPWARLAPGSGAVRYWRRWSPKASEGWRYGAASMRAD